MEQPKHPASAAAASELSRFAFVTFLMLNDNYLPGALTLAYGLRRQKPSASLVCLVTEGVSAQGRFALDQLFDEIIDVEPLYVPHSRRQERQDRPYFFTRINALRLGGDGDLGYGFEKIAVIDADVLPMRHYDRLFALDTPAGIINEHKSHFVQMDDRGGYAVPTSAQQRGEWIWHEIYGQVCPHGRPIPEEITDRVRDDHTNMGINGSLFVLEPSMREFKRILDDVERPEIKRYVGDLFDWPDMQYLTMRWSGRWVSIDARFSGLNGYPDLSVLYGTHFAGFKPWYFNRPKAMARYGRYEDFQLWFRTFHEMMTEGYPGLSKLKKLQQLLTNIRDFQPADA